MDFKTLESYREYLIYISRTYPSINSYLKGIHLSIDSWWPWRADDSWKMSMAEIRNALQQWGYLADYLALSIKPPSKVRIAPRLHMNIMALDHLFNSETPPYRQVQPSKTTVACYMFGDASVAGFGSSLEGHYRKLANLIFSMANAAVQDLLLHQPELFVFTDAISSGNQNAQGTYPPYGSCLWKENDCSRN